MKHFLFAGFREACLKNYTFASTKCNQTTHIKFLMTKE